MIFVQLETLAAGPFRRGQYISTCGDYWKIVDFADKLDWEWVCLTTPDQEKRKRAWDGQFCLARNRLMIVPDFTDVAPGNVIVSRDLNVCRQFCGAGGRAWWID